MLAQMEQNLLFLQMQLYLTQRCHHLPGRMCFREADHTMIPLQPKIQSFFRHHAKPGGQNDEIKESTKVLW